MAEMAVLLPVETELEPAVDLKVARRAVAPLRGLCVSCDLAPDCTLPRAAGVPVVFCEEWTALPAPSVIGMDPPHEEALPGMEERYAGGEERPRGLCATCEAFPTCAFSRAREGIWHCEEFS